MDIVKKATGAFQKGDYRTAKELYQQAADRYGQHLFSANIILCERALESGRPDALSQQVRHLNDGQPAQGAGGEQSEPDGPIVKQLAETQSLLEHYFSRCQELEYQLLDR